MNGSQVDRLARAFDASHTRRSAAAIFAAGSLPLLGSGATDARKKKKKKTCKAPKVKCGKQCLPAGSCCPGTKPCQGTCIPEAGCCTSADCGPCETCDNAVGGGGCGTGETCLANGRCGKTCAEDTGCDGVPQCLCNRATGDAVCRGPASGSGCAAATQTCVTTADCAAGKVCSSDCGGPLNTCLGLCDV
jgi:hypothetical protein